MATDNAGNHVSCWQQVLLDVAEPILDSSDIRQALDQSKSDAETLRGLIRTHTADLICAKDNPALEFVERLRTPAFVRYWRPILAASVVILVIIGLLSIDFSLIMFLVLTLAFCVAWFINLLWYGMRSPLQPVGATRYVLESVVVGPFLREQINQLLADRGYSDEMHVTRAPGLAELSDREQVIATSTLHDLAQLSKMMSSGSIGLSGPRGVGKTTLLRYFCDPSLDVVPYTSRQTLVSSRDVRIMISAPVEYATKDFILHLFEKFCETLLQASPDANPRNTDSVPGGRRPAKLGFVILGSVLVGIGAALALYVLLRPKHLPRLTELDKYLAVAAVSLIVGAAILSRQILATPLRRIRSRSKANIKNEAGAWLTRIRYLQTLTKGYSGTIHVPLSADLGATTTQQLAELQLTLPELVDRFRDFALRAIMSRSDNLLQFDRKRAKELLELSLRKREARTVLWDMVSTRLMKWPLTSKLAKFPDAWSRTKAYHADLARAALRYVQRGESVPNPRAVIAIDEIDRMSTASAERFLNDIKAIFGVRQCLYLVSVSDEALAMFEQRVLQGRSVFDSTFDEVVRARELNFGSCKQLLRRRIAGMPDVLIAFCQVISGGLPRDLIRMARLVVETCDHGEEKIAKLVATIVSEQTEILKRSLISEIGESNSEPTMKSIFRYLIRDDWPGGTADSMLAAVENDLANIQFGSGFKATLYLYATVGELFGTALPRTIMSLRNYDPTDAGCIDRLAYARNMISVNEEAAWQMIGVFRTAHELRMVKSNKFPESSILIARDSAR